MTFSTIPLNFTPCSEETVVLSPEQIDRAIALSQAIPNFNQQWRVYLDSLAYLGFEQWLEEQGTGLALTCEHSGEDSILSPVWLAAIAAVTGLQVNGFRVCLLTQGSFEDEFLTIPRAVVDIPEFVPHFYLWVEVLEEQELVTLRGFLKGEEMRSRTAELTITEDWGLETPVRWFNPDLSEFLLQVRCMDAREGRGQMAEGRRGLEGRGQVASLGEEIERELRNCDRELWEVLTWEQGVFVLTHPELLNWVYQQQCQQAGWSVESLLPWRDLWQLLTQPAINTARWLQNELDTVAEALAWTILPDLSPAGAFRTTTSEITPLIRELQANGEAIPPQARGASQEIELGGHRLRLYAITWSLFPQPEQSPEWTLLLVLGSRVRNLPVGIRLRVSDLTGVLYEERLEQSVPYLFTRVVGTVNEQFLVTVGLTREEEVILPPFGFSEPWVKTQG